MTALALPDPCSASHANASHVGTTALASYCCSLIGASLRALGSDTA